MTTSRGSAIQRVAVVTGTRAEYGLLHPVLRAVDKHPRLQPQLIVTGMHLLRKFGYTVNHIREDGWRIDARVRMQTGRGNRLSQTLGLAAGVAGIGRALDRLGSDTVVVLGDRIEALAGALAGATLGKTVAHIHGGDVAVGDIDDMLRHAITKLAHVHFAATEDAAHRILRLGEDPRHVHVVGAPGLDDLRGMSKPSRRWIGEFLGVSPGVEYALIVQHPIGRADSQEERDMLRTFQAVERAHLRGIIIYPNADPGNRGIIRAIRAWRQNHDWPVFESLPRSDYLRMLKGARLLVGNSSSGIIESATAGVAAVDIGPRQTGRLRCGPTVIHCEYGRDEIDRAVARAIRLRVRTGGRSIYGDGRSGNRIAAILAETRIAPQECRKRITY